MLILMLLILQIPKHFHFIFDVNDTSNTKKQIVITVIATIFMKKKINYNSFY